MDVRVTIKSAEELAEGDLIVNVGRIKGEAEVLGVFLTFDIEGGEWDHATGEYVRMSFPVTYHVADDVYVAVK